MVPRIVEASPLPITGESSVTPQTTELKYDENGVLIPRVEVTPEERDAKIKQLEKEIQVAQFKAALPTAAGRNKAEKILEQFQKGTMTYDNFHYMDKQTQRLYVMLHGTVEIPGMGVSRIPARKATPLSDEQKVILAKKKARRNRRKEVATASRRKNRK
jgi:hypothetical protein